MEVRPHAARRRTHTHTYTHTYTHTQRSTRLLVLITCLHYRKQTNEVTRAGEYCCLYVCVCVSFCAVCVRVRMCAVCVCVCIAAWDNIELYDMIYGYTKRQGWLLWVNGNTRAFVAKEEGEDTHTHTHTHTLHGSPAACMATQTHTLVHARLKGPRLCLCTCVCVCVRVQPALCVCVCVRIGHEKIKTAIKAVKEAQAGKRPMPQLG